MSKDTRVFRLDSTAAVAEDALAAYTAGTLDHAAVPSQVGETSAPGYYLREMRTPLFTGRR